MDVLITIGWAVGGILSWYACITLIFWLKERAYRPSSVHGYHPETFSEDKLKNAIDAVINNKWNGMRPEQYYKIHDAALYKEAETWQLAQYYYKIGDSSLTSSYETTSKIMNMYRNAIRNWLTKNGL